MLASLYDCVVILSEVEGSSASIQGSLLNGFTALG